MEYDNHEDQNLCHKDNMKKLMGDEKFIQSREDNHLILLILFHLELDWKAFYLFW